jgi:uncharacterized protein (DUF1697 family)
MPTHIALLRAVNLGPHNKIAMADLRALATKLGLRDAATLLNSGNVVFSEGKQTCTQLEQLLEAGVLKRLGMTTAFFVRNAAEWKKIIAGNPFEREAKDDPGHLLLLALKNKPTAAAITSLKEAIKGRETFHVGGTHAYFVYPDGVGNSKLTVGLIERKLETSVTGRNWNTVLKIQALLS